MSNILITGASGFIGANLVHHLSRTKNQINIFVREQSDLWRINDVLSKVHIHSVDLVNSKSLKKKIFEIKPDIVFHCATYGVLPYQKSISKLIKTNILGSVNLMTALTEYNNLERFVNLGSSFEYGTKLRPIKESELVEPITPYGIVKVTQTYFTKYFAYQKNLPSVTLRLFTPYGRYDEPGRLISDIMVSLVRKNKLTLFSPYAVRDFIHIDDVINAMMKAAKTPKIHGEVFNIGSGREYSVGEIVKFACEVAKTDIEIVWKNSTQREFDKAGGKGHADIKKSKMLLNWNPKHTIKEGLSKTYNWYKENLYFYNHKKR